MRICLVAESYSPALGGVEFSLQKLVEGFLAQGHHVQVITSSWQRHAPAVETHGAFSLRRIYSPPVLKRFWFLLFSLPHVMRAARWADIVQGSTFAGGPPAFLGAWLTGRKNALIVHEVFGRRWFQFERNFLRASFYVLTEWMIIHLPFHRYIAVSEYTKRTLRHNGIPEKKISVIYHGDSKLDNPALPDAVIRSQLGFSGEEYIFLLFGRTGVTKGFEYFIEAIPEISRKILPARFVLILSNYDDRIWRTMSKAISSFPPDVCRIVPQLSREMLAAYVSAANCVVIPSLSEGFGFCALEACNAKKTVVATNAGALPEIVFGTYVLVEPGSARALVDGCMKAWKGEVQVREPRNFDWDRTVEQYCALYKELLST